MWIYLVSQWKRCWRSILNILFLDQLTVLSFPLFLLMFNQLLVITLSLLVSPVRFLSLQDSNQDGEKAGKEKAHN